MKKCQMSRKNFIINKVNEQSNNILNKNWFREETIDVFLIQGVVTLIRSQKATSQIY